MSKLGGNSMTRVTNREGEKAAETETTRLEGGKNHINFFSIISLHFDKTMLHVRLYSKAIEMANNLTPLHLVTKFECSNIIIDLTEPKKKIFKNIKTDDNVSNKLPSQS